MQKLTTLLVTTLVLALSGFGTGPGQRLIDGRVEKKGNTKDLDDRDNSKTPQFRSETTAVRVPVVVIGDEGRLYTDLTRSDFRLLENGKEQEITNFAGGRSPLTLVVLIEFSSSVSGLRRSAVEPAGIFVSKALKPDDYVALISFDRRPTIMTDFTRNRQKLIDAVNKLVRSPAGFSDSSLFDAVRFALGGGTLDDQEYQGLANVKGRTGLLLLATGINTFSSSNFDETLHSAANSGVPVYSVGLGEMAYVRWEPYLSSVQRLTFLQAENNLKAISDISGGRSYEVRFRGALHDVLTSISTMLRFEYTLTYLPAPPQNDEDDAREIKVLVDVDGDGKPDNDRVTVQSREKYYPSLSQPLGEDFE